jgi:translation initiation factor IF-2
LPAQSIYYLTMGVSTINKVRVHELCKELGKSPKELLRFLNDLGANVRNHMSTIEDKFVEQARQAFPSQKTARFSQTTTTAETTVKAEPIPEITKQTFAPAQRPKQSAPSDARKTATGSANPKTGEFQKKTNIKKGVSGSERVEEQIQPKKAVSTKSRVKSESKPEIRAETVKPRKAESNVKARTVKSDTVNQTQQQKRFNQQSKPNNQSRSRNPQNQRLSSKQQSRLGPGMSRGPVARPTGKKSHFRSRGQHNKPEGPITNVKSVQLPPSMTVKDFSQLIEVAAGDVIKKLMGLGLLANINQEIDLDTMILLADEYKIDASAALTEEEKLQVEEIEDNPESLVSRPPVVTIMGHVDHGKTSLLDAIRETNVTAHEAGGITQHIGAYQVELKERKITFLDTPGHAAFTAMRARGAQATDIAILVVAADDGVMPQTVEALNHAKDANVPIIVAINKMDKPSANPDRVKQDLTEYGLVAEEWGGDTIFVPISAKKREGIEQLLEMILLVADMKDLKANPDRPAKGTIIEAKLDKGRGPVATVLIQTGTLKAGDAIIAGAAAGKVRVLINEKGKRLKKAGPSTPVEVIGFDELPEAGDILYAVTEGIARNLADKRMQLKRENELNQNQKVTLDDLFTKIKEGEIKELKIVLKADVQGSMEAIRQSLERLTNEEVRVKVIHGGVGGIGEGDVMLASASNAIIIGFNVRPDPMAKRIAEKENIDIRLYRIIYEIIDDIKKAMEGMLAPEFKEVILGRAEIRMVYKVPKIGNIAGCYVLEGKINRNSNIRLIRDNIVVLDGKIDSLKRFKDDVREVMEGFECGIGLEKYNDIKEGDIIEAYAMEEIKRAAAK